MNEHKIATIIGSYIVFILNTKVPAKDKSHASTIRLRQAIRVKLRKAKDKLELVPIADEVWVDIVEKYKGTSILPSTLIETLFFNHYDEMVAMYGQNIGDLVTRYVEKHQNNLHAKNSYDIADALSNAVKQRIEELGNGK